MSNIFVPGFISVNVTTGSLNASAPIVVTGGSGCVVGGSVNLALSTAATNNFLRGDGVWAVPADISTNVNNLNFTSPIVVTGVTTGVLVGGSANISIDTSNIILTSDTGNFVSTAGTAPFVIYAVTNNFVASGNTGDITFNAPLSITGITSGAIIGGSANLTVTTGNLIFTSPIVITGKTSGILLGGSANISIATPFYLSIPIAVPTATDNYLAYRANNTATITNIYGIQRGGTAHYLQVFHCDTNGATINEVCNVFTVGTSVCVASITTASVTSGNLLSYIANGVSGTVTQTLLNIEGHY